MIGKVKNWLGIEGVDIEVLDAVADTADRSISVDVALTTKSEQAIEGIRLIVKEKYLRGRRKSKMVDEYMLGEKLIKLSQVISPDETLEFNYSVRYELLHSEIDRMANEGNLFSRGIGHLAKLIKNAHSEYSITAEVIVAGNKLRPYDTFEIEQL